MILGEAFTRAATARERLSQEKALLLTESPVRWEPLAVAARVDTGEDAMTVLAYFITFSTYGTWLHGNEKGSVDRDHNELGQPLVEPDEGLMKHRQTLMKESPYALDEPSRGVVLGAIVQHAQFRGWKLLAAHVRTKHVHIVVSGDVHPDRMMNEFKAYATRALKRAKLDEERDTRWTRHGSTRWLTSDESVENAIQYTIEEQGDKMAVFDARVHPGEPRPPGSGF